MVDVNENNTPKPPPQTDVHDFTRPPAQDIYCLTPTCERFKKRPHSLEFAGEVGGALGLRCPSCQTLWKDATQLLREQDAWKTPYWGALAALFTVAGVWVLPWRFELRVAIAVLGGLAAISVLLDLMRRQKRLRTFQLLGWLGQPAGETLSSEVAQRLQQQLQGKVVSADGALKQELWKLIVALQKQAAPRLLRIRRALALRKHMPLEELQDLYQRALLYPEEQPWIEQRLAWLRHIDTQSDVWQRDIVLMTDILESVTSDLEVLRLGGAKEKEEARESLQLSLKEGRELLKRLEEIPD